MWVCTNDRFLSGIRTKASRPISFHPKTCHMHCPSQYSGCCSVPSSVSVSLETVASILLVLADGKIFTILLLYWEKCPLGETHSNPGHLDSSDSRLMNKEILYNLGIPRFHYMQLESLGLFLKKHSANYNLGTACDIHEFSSFILYHKNNLYAFLLYPTSLTSPVICLSINGK